MSTKKEPYWIKVEANDRQRLKDYRAQGECELKRYGFGKDELGEEIARDGRLMVSGITVASMGFVGGNIFIFCGHVFTGILLIVILILAGIVLGLRGRSHRNLAVKYSLVYRAIERYFRPEVYLARKSVPTDIVHELEMVEDWESAFVSDYFWGTWRGVRFAFGDLTIRGNGRHDRLFSGQLFIIETGLALEFPIVIREREKLLTPEELAAMGPEEYRTGNEAFDRQFAISLGIAAEGEARAEHEARAHALVDPICADIIEADAYAVSRTTMRFIGNRLYLAIENDRDTFELMKGDVQELDVLAGRIEDEVQSMTQYLDKICRNFEGKDGDGAGATGDEGTVIPVDKGGDT